MLAETKTTPSRISRKQRGEGRVREEKEDNVSPTGLPQGAQAGKMPSSFSSPNPPPPPHPSPLLSSGTLPLLFLTIDQKKTVGMYIERLYYRAQTLKFKLHRSVITGCQTLTQQKFVNYRSNFDNASVKIAADEVKYFREAVHFLLNDQ